MTPFNNIEEHQYKDSYYYVYELIDPRNNKVFYVGKGKNDRMYQHVEKAKKQVTGNKNINKIRKILSFGYTDVIYNKVIENITVEEAKQFEIFTIAKYGLKNLTNVTKGGDGGDVFSNNPNKEIIRNKMKNKSPETLKRLSEKALEYFSNPNNRKSNYNRWVEKYGKEEADKRLNVSSYNMSIAERPNITDETRQKLSEKAKSRSPEIYKRAAEKRRGQTRTINKPAWNKGLTKETCSSLAIISEKQKINNLGKIASEETKLKMSESQSLRWKRKRGEI